jgi:maltose O-acetyltransferase
MNQVLRKIVARLLYLPLGGLGRLYSQSKSAYIKSQFARFDKGSAIGYNIEVSWAKHIYIGKDVSIGSNVCLGASSRGNIIIGDRCAIAARTQFVTPTHDYNVLPVSSVGINKSIVVGDDVWIGTAAIILPGITIHDGAVIAAGAVVANDVPPNCIVGGVPARMIKKLESREVRRERGDK